MKKNSIIFLLLLTCSNVCFGQSCDYLWDRGKSLDQLIVSEDRQLNRTVKRYMDKIGKTLAGFENYVGKKETQSMHNDIQGKLEALSEYIEGIVEHAEGLQAYTEDQSDILNDILDLCPLNASNEKWAESKVDVLSDLLDSRGNLIDELDKLETKLEAHAANPAKLMRTIDLFQGEIRQLKRSI